VELRSAGRRAGETARPYRVLLVCTGNLVRSPAVELLLTERLKGATNIVVESAGTHAMEGAPMAPIMAGILAENGIKSDGFRSRQVAAGMVREATLILTAARRHRSIVVTQDPVAVRKTFTMLEFARLAQLVEQQSGDPDDKRRRLTDRLQELAKSRRAPLDPALDNLDDPYGRPERFYRECYAQMLAAVDVIAPVLRASALSRQSRPRKAAS
jgi:low molecular weight protein-tyrosine phosphatase